MNEDAIYPYRFAVVRHGGDDIRLDAFNEDGTGTGPAIKLTHAVAIELMRDLAAAIAVRPYGP